MNRRSLVAALAAAGALLMLSGPAGNATQIGSHDPDASQAPASSSTICSATTGTCVDVPGGTADVNTNAVGAA